MTANTDKMTNIRTAVATAHDLETRKITKVTQLTQYVTILQIIEKSTRKQLTKLVNFRRDVTNKLNRLEQTNQRYILSPAALGVIRESRDPQIHCSVISSYNSAHQISTSQCLSDHQKHESFRIEMFQWRSLVE